MKPDYATCGSCNRTWDDSIVTSMTPAPSGRCPFEYFHDWADVPDDWPVKEVEHVCEFGPVERSIFSGTPHRKCVAFWCDVVSLDLDDGTDETNETDRGER